MGCHLGFGETIGGSEELIGSGDSDGKEGAWFEPGSVLQRVQSHLHEHAGARPEKPTIQKLADLCEVMEVHPLTLLTLAYAGDSTREADELLAQVRQELRAILEEPDTP